MKDLSEIGKVFLFNRKALIANAEAKSFLISQKLCLNLTP